MLATLCAITAITFGQTVHTVKPGETLGGIADRHGLSSFDLARANGFKDRHALQVGQKVLIPKVAKTTAKPASKASGYVVRNGDHDWAIARRNDITLKQLHDANPGVNWSRLQIGTVLHVPGAKSAATVAAAPAAKKTVVASVMAGGSYTVAKNDNDWIIARKLGVASSRLRAVNPGVDWSRIQPGQKLRVPDGATAKSASTVASFRRTPSMKIAREDVIVREKPSTDSRNKVIVPIGTVAKVVDGQGDWTRLKFPKGTVGWVRNDMLKPIAGATRVAAAPKSTRSSKVASNARTRPAPMRNNRFARLTPVAKTGNAVIDEAMSHLGTPYRYGQMSRSGFDCSGLTTYVYKTQGVNLPRTSGTQAGVGQAVPKEELKKGDLVFFKTNRGTRINHVGIYAGNGKFVHASSGGGKVKVDTLMEGYYARRFAGARRVAKFADKPKVDAVAKVAAASPKTEVAEPKPAETEKPSETAPPASSGPTDKIGK
ncbi:MAG: C40 family peptidase [Fimbriimonadaceae bacterium]|nr:C40 family peptidase [Fimbriimonadaceae bacterium]